MKTSTSCVWGLLGLAATLLTSGCAGWNLSGLDGKSEFACAAPDGVSCMSVSGVSANVDRGNLPSSVKEREREELTRDLSAPAASSAKSKNGKAQSASGTAPRAVYAAEPTLSPATMLTVGSGTPVRVPPKEMRIWVAPTEDTEGDLHEQRYIYVVVNDGRWMVDATRLNPRNKYTQFKPLSGAATEGVPAAATATTGQAKPAAPAPQAQ